MTTKDKRKHKALAETWKMKTLRAELCDVDGRAPLYANIYQDAVCAFAHNRGQWGLSLEEALLELVTESAEVVDLVKKANRRNPVEGGEVDRERLADELGDVLWAVAYIAGLEGLPLSDIMRGNARKLAARFPERWSPEIQAGRAAYLVNEIRRGDRWEPIPFELFDEELRDGTDPNDLRLRYIGSRPPFAPRATVAATGEDE